MAEQRLTVQLGSKMREGTERKRAFELSVRGRLGIISTWLRSLIEFLLYPVTAMNHQRFTLVFLLPMV